MPLANHSIPAANACDRLDDRAVIVNYYLTLEQDVIVTQLAWHNQMPQVAHLGCKRIKQALAQLIAAVHSDTNHEAQQRLRLVYTYFFGAVIEADRQGDPSRLLEILPLVTELRRAWEHPRA